MRLFYTLLFVIFFQFSWAQAEWKYSEISYKEALVQAKKENKSLFIMLYATWCPHCNVMKSTVFSDPKVMDFLDKNYICTWINIEKEEGISIKNQYQTNGLPAFVFVDANETLLYRTKGEMKTNVFMYNATTALNPKKQLPYLEQ